MPSANSMEMLDVWVEGEHKEFLLKHLVVAVKKLSEKGTSEEWEALGRTVLLIKSNISLSMKKRNMADFGLYCAALLIILDALQSNIVRDKVLNRLNSPTNVSLLFSHSIGNPLPENFADLSLMLLNEPSGVDNLTFMSIYELSRTILSLPSSSSLSFKETANT